MALHAWWLEDRLPVSGMGAGRSAQGSGLALGQGLVPKCLWWGRTPSQAGDVKAPEPAGPAQGCAAFQAPEVKARPTVTPRDGALGPPHPCPAGSHCPGFPGTLERALKDLPRRETHGHGTPAAPEQEHMGNDSRGRLSLSGMQVLQPLLDKARGPRTREAGLSIPRAGSFLLGEPVHRPGWQSG